jgi:hypothetical protein
MIPLDARKSLSLQQSIVVLISKCIAEAVQWTNLSMKGNIMSARSNWQS